MPTKNTNRKCTLMIIADGFEETETIILLSALRQAGLWVKSVGLTSGLIGGAHGVWLMPDLTLADIDPLLDTATIRLVVLPEGSQSLGRLKADPRVHRLLRQVVARRGQIVTSPEGLQVPRAAAVCVDEPGGADDDQKTPMLLRDPAESLEAFARDLIQRLRK